MNAFYNLGIFLYFLAIRIAARFNPKALQWVEGRKTTLPDLSSSSKKVAWFHCASLGEFEQGRPLIENFRKKYPDWLIVLTFFSPSGFEVRKNYTGADHVVYLPADTPGNARNFLERINPSLAVFVKYEFWFNYLNGLRKRKTPFILVSAIFREDQYFFSWWAGWFRNMLRSYTKIFVQDGNSAKILKAREIPCIIGGDTRFDRVYEIMKQARRIEMAEYFRNNGKLIVAGSTWPEDEEILLSFMETEMAEKENFRLIIAPHEIHEEHLTEIESGTKLSVIRFSNATKETSGLSNIMLIDNIGMLSSLYGYADLAYVGGGFGKGIHNTLEPAAFGIPVIFGPQHEKFSEAVRLVEKKGGFTISSTNSFYQLATELLLKDDLRENAGRIAGNYVKENTGATEKIISSIDEILKR